MLTVKYDDLLRRTNHSLRLMTFSIKIIHHLISETQVCKCKQTDISSQADSKGKVESRGIKECIRSKKKKNLCMQLVRFTSYRQIQI